MIGFGPSRGRAAFDDVHAVHGPVRIGAAPESVIACVACESRKTTVEKIGVERNNNVGALKPVLRFDGLAKSHLNPSEHIIAVGSFPLVPAGSGICLEETLKLAGQRGGGDGLRQDAN